jgi:putative transcriptional regulator
MGYSGWSEAQLEFEMDEQTWIVCDALKNFIFSKDETQLWKNVMNHLGGDYKLMIHAPVYPRMN